MRTPLLRSLRELATELRLARKTRTPLDVVQHERQQAALIKREARISRRALLGGAAAAAGVLALPKRARAWGGNQPDIAIVGGGMAGMACANVLRQEGVKFTVYEASGRIGGRMYSNNDGGYWSNNQITEWGGELIDSGHDTMHRLAEEFGLEMDDLFTFEQPGATEVYKVGGSYYPKPQADADFLAMFDAVLEDEAAAGYPTTWNDSTQHGRALDAMSVHQYIATRVPGGHSSKLGKVLDLAYAIEYAADTTDQSALNLLYLLAYQDEPVVFSAFGVSDERYHIRGGNQQLPKKIAQSLPQGSIEMGAKLVKVKRTSGNRTKLTFERDGCTFDKTFDWVVMCLPFAILRELDYADADFDQRKRKAIAELGRGHATKLQLQFTQRKWAGTGPWPGVANGSTYSDVGYQASWEPTRGQAGSHGILNLFSGGSVADSWKTDVPFATASNTKVKQDAEKGFAQIKQVFPGLNWNGKATMSVWAKNPFAKHAYAYYRVGQYTKFGGYEGKRQHGVLFAGDHTSQDFQGFMNGAASEGERAAYDLLDLL